MKKLLPFTAIMKRTILSILCLLCMCLSARAGIKEDVITAASLNYTTEGATYVNFSGKTLTSDAVYAGTLALRTSTNSMQFKAANSAGLVTTASGGKVKTIKAEIHYNSGSANGESNYFKIYGRTEAQGPYTAASNLYDSSTRGTQISSTSVTRTSGGPNTTVSVDVSGKEYAYLGFTTTGGQAIYVVSITVEWEKKGPEAPVITPATGPYTLDTPGTTASINCATPGASIYYTMGDNPADPTAESTLYTGELIVNRSTTIKAVAYLNGNASDVVTSQIELKVPTPTFTRDAGIYEGEQTTRIECTNPGATIYYSYSTDESEPTTLYTPGTDITLATDGTLRAKAEIEGWTTATASANYTILIAGTTATPVIGPEQRTYTDGETATLTLTCDTPDATIYYTLDGSDPTDLDNTERTEYDPEATVSIDKPTTVKAYATKAGNDDSEMVSATFTFKLVAPVADHAGTAAEPCNVYPYKEVELTAAEGATILYTFDADAEVEDWEEYTPGTKLVVYDPCTLRAIAKKEGYIDSDMLTSVYVYTAAGSQNVEDTFSGTTKDINNESFYDIGTTPTLFSNRTLSSGTVYAGYISARNTDQKDLRFNEANQCGIVSTSSVGTIKSVGIGKGYGSAGRCLQLYGKDTPYSSAADLYSDDPATRGELIADNIDGKASSGFTVTIPEGKNYKYVGIRIKAGDVAVYVGYVRFNWAKQDQVEQAPEFSLDGEVYSEQQVLEMTSAMPGAKIYYTLDGTEPTEAEGTLYAAPITLADGKNTVKAVAVKPGMRPSDVTEKVYYVKDAQHLAEVNAIEESGEPFIMNHDVVVTYHYGAYTYIATIDEAATEVVARDAEGEAEETMGTYGLIYDPTETVSATPGDVINSGWMGKVEKVNGYNRLVPTSTLASESTAAVPQPAVMRSLDVLNDNNLNRVVVFESVKIDNAVAADDEKFKGYHYYFGANVAFNNPFGVELASPGDYEVTTVLGKNAEGKYNFSATAINPVGTTTGVENVGVDNAAPVYYNLQGVRIERPARGTIVIEVVGDKARKLKL